LLVTKSKSRYSYALAKTNFFVEEVRQQFKLPETDNYKDFIELQKLKQANIDKATAPATGRDNLCVYILLTSLLKARRTLNLNC
jgi:hypothetical protein